MAAAGCWSWRWRKHGTQGWPLQVYEFNVPTFGKGVVFDVDHKVRGEQFRFFAEALKTQRMRLYVPQFVQEAQARPG